MHRKAFILEKEKISNIRDAFSLEVSQMAVLRKDHLEEKRGMEVEREALLNINILKTDQNKNSVNTIKKAPKGLKKARPLKRRRN
ncbi:hypothetical protein NHX12_009182 [Muraenolepis orangiensis]|uniref:Uncharacterized protein n=1 Tax=Muraenolepis orangiensis TaxID=630683 RepID=A0A9Q0IBY5_9TELE|nr:hypothetical protein NHX12_009182 [Muraenolepis orangiensis]